MRRSVVVVFSRFVCCIAIDVTRSCFFSKNEDTLNEWYVELGGMDVENLEIVGTMVGRFHGWSWSWIDSL